MNPSTECHENAKPVWETPVFTEIPIAFEASSYAMSEDTPIYR